MNVMLSLRRDEFSQRPAAAWFVPGEDPCNWLREMTSWNVTLIEARLYCVAVAQSSQAIAGLLVVLPPEVIAKAQVSPRCQAYGVLGEQLFLPVEARIEPLVRSDELSQLLPSLQATYLWHPTLGLIAYEPQDALRVSDLLAQPILCAARWDRAQPGVALNDRLISIEPEEPLNLLAFMQSAQDNIGDSAQRLDDLPKHPQELGPLGKAGGAIVGGIADGISWALKKAGGQAGAMGGMLGGLQSWAERQSAQWSNALQLQRNRQLARLLEMLDKNPDEGLRYALPLAGDAAPRGVATPGWKLLQRNVDFHLGSLGGGQAVDSWDAGAYRLKLIERYRELANRELGLGRYRRAAYIFAELLGDLRAAAQALQTGAHFREAAALYKDRLHLPHEAARCLMAGQHWTEAVTLYEELHEYEKIGELYEKLADPERSTQAYRQAIARLERQGDLLNAARLLEEKLNDVDGADARLWNAWPGGSQAAKCLEASFKLLARYGRHQEAARRVRFLTEEPCLTQQLQALVDRLVLLATDYPDRDLQRLAADRTRVLVSRHLPSTPFHRCGGLLAAISRLVPHDRVLKRDSQRFLQGHLALQPRTAAPLARKREINLARRYQLPGKVQWNAVAATRYGYLAAGWHDQGICVARGNWRDQVQLLTNSWSVTHRYSDEMLLVASLAHSQRYLLHAHLAEPIVGDRAFAPHDGFPDTSAQLRPLDSLSRNAFRSHFLNDGRLITLEWSYEGSMLVIYYSQGGDNPLGVREIGRLEESAEITEFDRKLVSASSGNDVYIGLGSSFTIVTDASVRTESLGQRICGLYGSHLPLPPQIGISFAAGALLLGGPDSGNTHEWIARDLCEPRIAFLPLGKVVAVAEQGMEVYRGEGGNYVFDRKGMLPSAIPLAVLPTDIADQFVVFFTNGEVRVYTC